MLRVAAAAAAAHAARHAPAASCRGIFALTALADGNLGHTALTRSGTLMGEDSFGNKYYENMSYQAGRHRWVVFADAHNYSARSVPREWHGWLHQVTDAAPTRVAQYHPPYEVPALSGGYGNTGFGQSTAMAPSHEVHFPKGHLKASPGRKSWARFTEWKPPAAK